MKKLSVYLAIAVLSQGILRAQEEHGLPDEAKRYQEEALSSIKDVEELILRLSAKLRETQPENARKLVDAEKALKEHRVAEEMKDILKEIDLGHYAKARNKADEVKGNLEKILASLLDSNGESAPKVADTVDIKRQLRELIEEQEALLKRTEEISGKGASGGSEEAAPATKPGRDEE